MSKKDKNKTLNEFLAAFSYDANNLPQSYHLIATNENNNFDEAALKHRKDNESSLER